MAKTMKALVKAKSEPGIWMEDVPIPEIEPNEVLIRVHRASICGTDMHIYKWDPWAQANVPVPMVTGHEYGGEVVAVGSTVRRVQVGQRVSGEGHVVGNRSRNARSGRWHLDPDTKGIGVNLPGAFAEYVRLPEFNVIPLPDELPMDIAAILDPLGNAVHTALTFDLVGEDVLITGAGPIGIMSAAVARQAGARRILITDVNQWRLDFAKKINPRIHTVNVVTESLEEKMDAIGMREGFDVGFEMSGAEPAFKQMIDTMIMGGNVAMLGLPPKPFPIDIGKVVLKALTLRGIYGRQMYDTWYKMLAMLDSGLELNDIITHRFACEDYQQAFDVMLGGECGKVILNWEN
jgi:threonine 3-dehydrogenase